MMSLQHTFVVLNLKYRVMENKNKNNRIILGAIVFVLGALLLLDNLELIHSPVSDYILNWKTLFIAVGGYLLLAKQKMLPGILMISLGVTFWLPAIFAYRFTLEQIFLPFTLIIAGSLLLFRYKLLNKNNDGKVSDSAASAGKVEEAR
jgi:predicted membrane protein